MAKGTANMEGDHNTHGAPLPQKEIDLSKLKLGLPNDKFYFPEKYKMYYQSRFSKLSAVVKLWNDRKEQLSSLNNTSSLVSICLDEELLKLFFLILHLEKR